ncbi:hypothetical protein KN815_43700 [Streptomyces sp. 4503]|uniref:Secreted protein n=1 Tax=Streptomyces niphimycinicus TaxID=2842201 RepID=A0ABS6CUY2_9ACTN|nr:hypothetical protein [Streptomyces niphimycinicus]MBU3870708.1 hypothetical protein [Streptomyces niphimycinicus]
MLDTIVRVLVWVRAVLALRPSGRHRAVPGLPASYPALSRPVAGAGDSAPVRPGPVPRPYTDSPTLELLAIPLPLDGELPALVRPYMVTDERRQQRRPRTGPRVELICAPHGMVVIR